MAKKMTENELLAYIGSEIDLASGHMSSELSAQREDAMKYYLGEKFGNEIDGRSEIVTTDVRDTVEYIMPSLMRIFTTHNNIAEFEPQGPEDVEMAQQATDYCNYVFNRQNEGFKVLYDVFKDALISKTGIVKHYWEEKAEQSRETYTNLTEIEYQSILANDDIEILELTDNLVQESQKLPDGTETPDVYSYDVVAMRKKVNGQVRIMSVPPEEFLISRRAVDLQTAPFICHRVKKTVSDLILEGYDEKTGTRLPAPVKDDFQKRSATSRLGKLGRLQRF